MQLIVDPKGDVHAIYGEAIDLAALGELTIRRASQVEPDEQARWWADLSPVQGPSLGPFARRSEALEAERNWLEQNGWLPPGPSQIGGPNRAEVSAYTMPIPEGSEASLDQVKGV